MKRDVLSRFAITPRVGVRIKQTTFSPPTQRNGTCRRRENLTVRAVFPFGLPKMLYNKYVEHLQ